MAFLKCCSRFTITTNPVLLSALFQSCSFSLKGIVRFQLRSKAPPYGKIQPVSYTHLTLPTNREV